jgi:hypothetical protein
LTGEAAAAGDREGDDDTVTDLEVILEPGTDLHDFTHELMPEDITLLHAGDKAIKEVQVGTTNRR